MLLRVVQRLFGGYDSEILESVWSGVCSSGTEGVLLRNRGEAIVGVESTPGKRQLDGKLPDRFHLDLQIFKEGI